MVWPRRKGEVVGTADFRSTSAVVTWKHKICGPRLLIWPCAAFSTCVSIEICLVHNEVEAAKKWIYEVEFMLWKYSGIVSTNQFQSIAMISRIYNLEVYTSSLYRTHCGLWPNKIEAGWAPTTWESTKVAYWPFGKDLAIFWKNPWMKALQICWANSSMGVSLIGLPSYKPCSSAS